MSDIDADEYDAVIVPYRRLFPDASETADALNQIRAEDETTLWADTDVLHLGNLRWRPAAIAEASNSILHICASDSIPSYILKRINASLAAGFRICIALRIEALYQPSVLETLAAIDAKVYITNDHRVRLRPIYFMAAIADLAIPIDPVTLSQICEIVWRKMDDGSAQERGSRYEAVLACLFSQLSDLRVAERNFNNVSQEIDIILQVDRISSRVWQESGVPFLLVEAKNTDARTPTKVTAGIVQKVRTKRKLANIGMVVSRSGFTSPVKLEQARTSESNTRIVLLGGPDIETLFRSQGLDDTLETIVRRELLS